MLLTPEKTPNFRIMSSESGDLERRHYETLTDECLTAALLDRLTHHAHIIELIGESYRFSQRMQTSEESGCSSWGGITLYPWQIFESRQCQRLFLWLKAAVFRLPGVINIVNEAKGRP